MVVTRPQALRRVPDKGTGPLNILHCRIAINAWGHFSKTAPVIA